ncbi:MAG: class II glutamine amidotransferase, partial [Myxococcales bacterium]|nr:class II glutamine amidotransferase [Myxococcales bacterium]
MSQLLGMSFDAPASPSITLLDTKRREEHRQKHFGWGMGWYPPNDRAAVVIKDPTAIRDNEMTRMLRDWVRFRSSTFICHLRGAAQRASQEDTQPVARTYAGRQWIVAHNGQLLHGFASALTLDNDPMAEPVGTTDTEHILCWLFGRLKRRGARKISDVPPREFQGWLAEANLQGTLNLLLTDGETLVVYQDQDGFNPLHWCRRTPPHENLVLKNKGVSLDMGSARDGSRTVVLVATDPLSEDGWTKLEPGQLLGIRNGSIVWNVSGGAVEYTWSLAPADEPERSYPKPSKPFNIYAPRLLVDDNLAPSESVLRVTHKTAYTYEQASEQSEHVLRLRPVNDVFQTVLEFDLEVSPECTKQYYQDVFGNSA